MTLTYVCCIILRILELLTFIISLLFCYRSYNPKYLRIFPIYHFSACLVEVVVDLYYTPDESYFKTTSNIPYNLFVLIEFFFFLYFILKQLRLKQYRLIIFLGAFLVVLYILYLTYIYKSFNFSVWKGTLVTSMFYIPACLLYFLYITKELPFTNLLKEPSFWIVSGFLFYSVIEAPTLPMILTYKSVYMLRSLYVAVNCTAYTILYLSLIKAYTCRIPK